VPGNKQIAPPEVPAIEADTPKVRQLQAGSTDPSRNDARISPDAAKPDEIDRGKALLVQQRYEMRSKTNAGQLIKGRMG